MAFEWQTPEYDQAMGERYEAIRDRYPTLVGGHHFACYSGWFPLIEAYLAEVERLLAEHPGSTYELRQVKEKFAGLKIYSWPSDDIREAVQAAYHRAEAQSLRTCEVCGRPGSLHVRGSWFMARCEEHADGGVPHAWTSVRGGDNADG